jgi:hypothetical protein
MATRLRGSALDQLEKTWCPESGKSDRNGAGEPRRGVHAPLPAGSEACRRAGFGSDSDRLRRGGRRGGVVRKGLGNGRRWRYGRREKSGRGRDADRLRGGSVSRAAACSRIPVDQIRSTIVGRPYDQRFSGCPNPLEIGRARRPRDLLHGTRGVAVADVAGGGGKRGDPESEQDPERVECGGSPMCSDGSHSAVAARDAASCR